MVESILAWVAVKVGIPPWLAGVIAAMVIQYILLPKTSWTAIKDFFRGFGDLGKNLHRRGSSEWKRVWEKIVLLQAVNSKNEEVRAAALEKLDLPANAKVDVANETAMKAVKVAGEVFARNIGGVVEDLIKATLVDGICLIGPLLIRVFGPLLIGLRKWWLQRAA